MKKWERPSIDVFTRFHAAVFCAEYAKNKLKISFLFFVRASFLPSSIGTNVVVVVVVEKCENILYKHTAEQNRAVECGIGEEVRVSEREWTANRTNNVSKEELYGNFVVYTLGEASECSLPYTEHSCASFIFVVFLTHLRNFVFFLHKPVLPDRDRYQNAGLLLLVLQESRSAVIEWNIVWQLKFAHQQLPLNLNHHHHRHRHLASGGGACAMGSAWDLCIHIYTYVYSLPLYISSIQTG